MSARNRTGVRGGEWEVRAGKEQSVFSLRAVFVLSDAPRLSNGVAYTSAPRWPFVGGASLSTGGLLFLASCARKLSSSIREK